jgi:hypothetical protein
VEYQMFIKEEDIMKEEQLILEDMGGRYGSAN